MWLHSHAMLSTESSFLTALVADATPALHRLEDMRRDMDNYNSKYNSNNHSKKAFLNKHNSGSTLFVGLQPASVSPQLATGPQGPWQTCYLTAGTSLLLPQVPPPPMAASVSEPPSC